MPEIYSLDLILIWYPLSKFTYSFCAFQSLLLIVLYSVSFGFYLWEKCSLHVSFFTLFHLIRCPPVPSILLVTQFHSLGWITFCCVYLSHFFIHWFDKTNFLSQNLWRALPWTWQSIQPTLDTMMIIFSNSEPMGFASLFFQNDYPNKKKSTLTHSQ